MQRNTKFASSSFDDFTDVKELYRSSAGAVYLAKFKYDNKKYVIKERKVAELGKRKDIMNEVSLLSQLVDPNVVKCEGWFHDVKKNALYIVLEYCNGGDLHSMINRRSKTGRLLDEKYIWFLFHQICLGVKALHEIGIVHRDLKTMNIMIKDGGRLLKLADLGVSRQLSEDTMLLKTFYGTPLYLSPELVECKPYNEKTDLWSLGVILYELCTLIPPFKSNSMLGLANKVIKGKFEPIGSQYSKSCMQCINWLLQKNFIKRPNIMQLLNYVEQKLTVGYYGDGIDGADGVGQQDDDDFDKINKENTDKSNGGNDTESDDEDNSLGVRKIKDLTGKIDNNQCNPSIPVISIAGVKSHTTNLPKSEVLLPNTDKNTKNSKNTKFNNNDDNDNDSSNSVKIDNRKFSPPKNRIFNRVINNVNSNGNMNNNVNNNDESNKIPLTKAQIAYEEELQSRFGDRRSFLPKKQSEINDIYSISKLSLNKDSNNNSNKDINNNNNNNNKKSCKNDSNNDDVINNNNSNNNNNINNFDSSYNLLNGQDRKSLLLSKQRPLEQLDNNIDGNVLDFSKQINIQKPSLNINLNTSPLTNNRKIGKQTTSHDIIVGNKDHKDHKEREKDNNNNNYKDKKDRSISPFKKEVIINATIPIDIQRVQIALKREKAVIKKILQTRQLGNPNLIIDSDTNNANGGGRAIRPSTAGLYSRGNTNGVDDLDIKLKSSLAKVNALEISLNTGVLEKNLAISLNLAINNDNNIDKINNNNNNNNNLNKLNRDNSVSPLKMPIPNKKDGIPKDINKDGIIAEEIHYNVNSAFEKPSNDLFKNKNQKHFLFHDDKLKELSPSVTKVSSNQLASHINNNLSSDLINNKRPSTSGIVNNNNTNSRSKINIIQPNQHKQQPSNNNNNKRIDIFATTLPEDENKFNKYRYNFITGVHSVHEEK